MSQHSHTPYIMTDTDQFSVRVCGCGVVHVCFGPTLINLAPEAMIAVTETLKEVSSRLRRQLMVDPMNADAATLDSNGTVIRGHFPVRSGS